MGWRFEIEHANIVAYITTTQGNNRPLFLKYEELAEFLASLSTDSTSEPQLISSDPKWIVAVKSAASQALESLRRSHQPRSGTPIPQEFIKYIFQGLMRLLADYKFF